MDKPTLYTDCDGVVFDTIDVGLLMMIEMGCDMTNPHEIDRYFRMLDWREVFKKAHEINNSIERLRELKERNLFNDMAVLTGLCGNYLEEGTKRDIFRLRLPGTRVITLQRGISKALVVPHRENSILVDDELKICNSYEKYGGRAILFKKDTLDLDNNIINDLKYVPETKAYKELTKTRYF